MENPELKVVWDLMCFTRFEHCHGDANHILDRFGNKSTNFYFRKQTKTLICMFSEFRNVTTEPENLYFGNSSFQIVDLIRRPLVAKDLQLQG